MREIPKFVALGLMRGYKWAISPMFPPSCRYVPTCSEYAMEAVERYGVLRGGWMSFARLMRCHPFAQGGFDPVVKRARGVKPAEISDTLRGAEAPLFHGDVIDSRAL